MIPLLFPANDRTFLSHGYGPIPDATRCTVTEDLDGRYELTLTLPANSARMADLTARAIILAKPNPYDPLQPFRIYRQTRQTDLLVTLRAQHISYDLNGYPVWPLSATGAPAAVNAINAQQTSLGLGNPFTLHTDFPASDKVFSVEVPTPERSVIGGASGSIRSVFGGELRFDAFDVYHSSRRGSDRGCVLAYRKSILELRQEQSIEDLYTAVVPYYHDGTTGTFAGNPQPIILGADWVNYKPVDVSEHFTERPADETMIDYWGAKWAEENLSPYAKISFAISTVPPGSVGLDGIEDLQLGDTVGVRYEILGIEQTAVSGANAKKRVTSYTYDVLRDRYTDLQIGERKPTAAEAICDAGRLSTGEIPSGRYGARSIGGSAIGLGAVGTETIADQAVTNDKLTLTIKNLIAQGVHADSVVTKGLTFNEGQGLSLVAAGVQADSLTGTNFFIGNHQLYATVVDFGGDVGAIRIACNLYDVN